ncbi:sigma-70 family RNA polymerase sigma factor [Lentzea sp. BCCO 10_0798]|uniref:Sigma-70 family RNA polymerase sigma factor n=1 Tax=Lentzea kristufekii TaxID=3095430 RepID=A0ABU4TK06_9PSEU|nr:sigma-70 family RNA polymerase sigma factor [Lentzea sp. BCCO 10_0798]MDX8048525.1 sigma-70 family RNA polymerase sigma factor [Lentzea sp. BCCO 10_0798]
MAITGKRGDLDLRDVYAAHGPEIYRFALRQLGDGQAAEEAVQEVFLRAWRSAERFDPDLASLRVWLFAIARNVVIDEARARARHNRRLHAVAANPPTNISDFADAVLDQRLVEEALLRISDNHRVALVETYLRGRSYRDVAADVGVSQVTLRSRVFFGLKSLRLAMEEMGVRL